MKIEDHLLKGTAKDKVKIVNSPNIGKSLKADTVIIHYTAGRDAESSVKTLCDPNVKASAHLVVGRDGMIFQLVPFNVVAWHAGKSAYDMPDGTRRVGFNRYSIGIEIDNAGVLTRSGKKFVSWFGREYDEPEVFTGVHRNESEEKYWHRYTETQISLVEDICRMLIQEYGIQYILGHEEISPYRKIDPGPAFPLDKMRDKLLHSARDQDLADDIQFPAAGTVTAGKLNFRTAPLLSAQNVARPLPRGKNVKILQEQNGWYRISTTVEGWVSKEYVDIQK